MDAPENVLTLEYNGVTVRCSTLISWDREPVYQGPDFLYTRHRLHVLGVVHSGYNWTDVGDQPGPQEQDETLLRLLQAPRKILTIKAKTGEGRDFKDEGSPWIKTKLDQDVGPRVVSHRISTFRGSKACNLELVVEFTDHQDKTTPPPVILSNRWEMIEDMDRFFRKRIRVRGRAIFRRDGINEKFSPDQFRKWCLWPLQKGYRRAQRSAGVGQNGLELIYETVDEQTSLDIYAAQIADVQVIHKYIHARQSVETMAFQIGEFAARKAATAQRAAARHVKAGGGSGEFGLGAWLTGRAEIEEAAATLESTADLTEGIADFGRLVYGMMPRHQGMLVVWVKGTPHAAMPMLANAARAIHKYRLDQLELTCPSVNIETAADFDKREVTIISTHEAAPIIGNLKIALDSLNESSDSLLKKTVDAVTGFILLEPKNLDKFFASEVSVDGVVKFTHQVAKDAPQKNNRGDGSALVMVAKALIDDTSLPISADTEAKFAAKLPLSINPLTLEPN